jgi:hypothetical protein
MPAIYSVREAVHSRAGGFSSRRYFGLFYGMQQIELDRSNVAFLAVDLDVSGSIRRDRQAGTCHEADQLEWLGETRSKSIQRR